ncbi:MAG: hypothetical protein SNG49_08925 [Rikenellaceae bacterium]
MDTTLLLIIICYLIVTILCLLSAVFAPEVDECERIIEPIKITPEKKEVSQIVGATKSERLIPPPPKEEKKNPAQVPADEVDDLFDEKNKPMDDVEFEGEYDPLPTKESLPEMGEVISINDNNSAMEVENRFISKHTCLDYNQIETTSKRVVRGEATEQDRDIIAQLDGTDIFAQIQSAMTTTNLKLVRSILNNI